MAGLGAGAGAFTADQQHQKVELERARLRQQARQFKANRKDQQEARRQSQENFDVNRQDQLGARQQTQSNWELARQDQLENHRFNQDVTTQRMGWEEALHSERMEEAKARRDMYEQNFNVAKERFAEEQRMMENRKFLAQSAIGVAVKLATENRGTVPASYLGDLSEKLQMQVVGGFIDPNTGDLALSVVGKDGNPAQEVIPRTSVDMFMQSIYGPGGGVSGGGRRVAAGGQAEQSNGSLNNDLTQLKRLIELRDAEMDPERRREYDGWIKDLRSRIGGRFGAPSSDDDDNTGGGTFLDGLKRPKGITGKADQAAPRPPKAEPQPESDTAPKVEEPAAPAKPATQEEPAAKRASKLWAAIEGYKKQREEFPDKHAGATQRIEAAQKELAELLRSNDSLVLPTDGIEEKRLVADIKSARTKLGIVHEKDPRRQQAYDRLSSLGADILKLGKDDKKERRRLEREQESARRSLRALEQVGRNRMFDAQKKLDDLRAQLFMLRERKLGFPIRNDNGQ